MGFVVVTHPFHPLTGQRLEILYVKRRAADMVFVCAGGVYGSITLPQAWTDRGEAAEPNRLSAEGLAAVDVLVRVLGGWVPAGEPAALDTPAGGIEGR